MNLRIREMQAGEADEVAELVRGLARHVGSGIVPELTGALLVSNRDLVDIIIAEACGRLVGACLTLLTFSTWRGEKGLYVVDLFVDAEERGRSIGFELLKEAALRGARRGASFIKLEVGRTNLGAARFYERLGFKAKDEDRLFILEQDSMDEFMKGKVSP